MFVQIKRIVVTEGNSEKIVERFGSKSGEPSLLERQPGFLDKQVLVKKVRRGDEEVLVMVRWESEEAWKNWEKSPEHIAGHKASAGQPKPEFVIESGQEVYYVKG
ncbi:antibiotic biosynthesis monooxygenase [Metasolibacillus sp.]|uniref:antibiotic biosynthesis monooxygenase family protein n=1 Tax=Metasolibacillus sp. TaxID=2703680 RepID=UPI0025D89529|nr:antibiotic biosynthesis monooxygenase [Metasolibacillus sp.]MCT6925986.1 antibiotic biosynthesis monooxygenase [Metasolibacillus sp.]MCT6942184.1 antibiotic biosynthesis monooxygenase [Metasolibacillus sp.]